MSTIPSRDTLLTEAGYLGEAFDRESGAPLRMRFYLLDEHVYVDHAGTIKYYCPEWAWRDEAEQVRRHYEVRR